MSARSRIADGIGEVGNPVCGDIMKIFLKIENNIVTDAKFKTFGCGAAIASSSMATELVQGKTLEEAWEVSNKAVAEALEGLPPIKMHCSVLAEEGIHKAINDYRKKQGLDPWVEKNPHSHDARGNDLRSLTAVFVPLFMIGVEESIAETSVHK